jgi:hypothetical protein
MDKPFSKPIFDLLERGNDDWCLDTEVLSVVFENYGKMEHDEQIEIAIAIVEIVLRNGLMEAGSYDGKKGFSSWNISIEDSIRKIRNGWNKPEYYSSMGDLFWLDITPAGIEEYKKLKIRFSNENIN